MPGKKHQLVLRVSLPKGREHRFERGNVHVTTSSGVTTIVPQSFPVHVGKASSRKGMPKNHIGISSDNKSRHSGKIIQVDGNFLFIKHPNCRDSVRLNEMRLTRGIPQALFHGSKLKIGKLLFKVELKSEK